MDYKFLSKLPFENAPFRHSLGLNKISEKDWFEINDPDERAFQMGEKRKFLSKIQDEVFMAEPSALKASEEVLKLMLKHLPKYHPNHYSLEDNYLFVKPHLGFEGEKWSTNIFSNGYHPLDLSARLVQEDLVIMLPTNNSFSNGQMQWHLKAGSVAFPSRWNLQEKFGKSMDMIHIPVPLYKEQIQQFVNQFFNNMPINDIYERRNWSLYDSSKLRHDGKRLPDYNKQSSINSENSGKRLWLRVERQTLKKLPISGGILFTIRIHLKQLNKIVKSKEIRKRLINALSALPPEIRAYKQTDKFTDSVLNYLNQQ
tara:strand:+ start:3023 stop:3961 length:939 start_codon:yes stop_codon:yes gene_type:complete